LDAAEGLLGVIQFFAEFMHAFGLGFHQSPFAGDDSFRQSFSLGLGMREQSFFFDLAYRWQTVMDLYIPYLTSQSPEQIVENDTTISQFLLTVGFRF